jgi:tRNA/rRNA methyltransferase
MGLAGVRIVLVEPAGALNVGAIARVMKNFGLAHLVLVNPQCDPLAEEAMRMAVHAKEILESAVLVATLPEALHGCVRAIATTGRDNDWDMLLEHPRVALPWLLEDLGQPSALIFGREDRGLSNEELNYAQRFIRIPTSPNYLSLNLASAVGICCYELTQNTAPPAIPSINEIELAPLELVEGFYGQLETLLLKIGYLFPHTATSRMAKFRQLYNRAYLQTHEVAMLRGILRQLEWAINRQRDDNS